MKPPQTAMGAKRMIEKMRQTRLRLFRQWNVRHVALIMLVIALAIALIGYLNLHHWLTPFPIVADFYANVSTELASIALTVLVIDALNERRSIQQEKESLILQMSSPTNSIAREAVRVLRRRGWLTDGSLKGINLQHANLRKAFLEKADLRDVFLYKTELEDAYLQWANLQGARKLEEHQLAQVKYLRGATLPDGSRYNGRFNLRGDLSWARDSEKIALDDSQAMADFYKVSLQNYQEGQAWAQENLSELRCQTMASSRKGFDVADE
jgi:hypothetical protein